MVALDKQLHFIVGFMLGGIGCFVHPVLGIALSFGAGAAKEVYDKVSKKGTPEMLDFLATALGGFVSVLLYGFLKWALGL